MRLLQKLFSVIYYFDLLTQSKPLTNLPVITTDTEVLIAKLIFLIL